MIWTSSYYGLSPLLIPLLNNYRREYLRGALAPLYKIPPMIGIYIHIMERGIKGVR